MASESQKVPPLLHQEDKLYARGHFGFQKVALGKGRVLRFLIGLGAKSRMMSMNYPALSPNGTLYNFGR